MKFTITFALLFLFLLGFGQLSEPGIPWSKEWSVENNNVPIYELTIPKTVKPVTQNSTETDLISSMQFAYSISVDKNSDQHGQWTDMPNGSRLWRIHLKSTGAYSLNFTFSKFNIPEGGKVYVYSPGMDKILGAFTINNVNKSGILPISPIAGDEIIIEYNEPSESIFSGYLEIGHLGHDYMGVFGPNDENFGRSGDCNVDINCSEGDDWQVEKNAVCRMIINNSDLCTGTLVNNALQNGDPFVLTANHCVNSQHLAENTIFVFNYESPSCGGVDGSVEHSITGAELIATKNKDKGFLDFTLLKLSQKVPISWNPYFAGWDSRGSTSDNSVCIHHPWADVMKISVDKDASIQSSYISSDGFDPNTFWKIEEWEAGMTQGGSSGSPLFNQDKRVIGTLTGGDAKDCNDEPVNDFYQMFSISYDKYSSDSMQLKNWLDPHNSGILMMDGYNPKDYDIDVDDLILVSNFEGDAQLAFYTANAGGYLSGNNIYQDKKKAEYFDESLFDGRNVVTNVHVAFAYATGNDDEDITMEIYDTEKARPNAVIGSTNVKLSLIKQNADKDYVTFKFDPPVIISGSVFASITLPQTEGDTIALMNTDSSVVEVNTAWEMSYYDEWWWYDLDEGNGWGMKTNQVMFLEIGKLVTSIKKEKGSSFNVFPNPASDEITIVSTEYVDEARSVQIVDAIGRVVYMHLLAQGENNLNIAINSWEKGLYILRITTDEKLSTQKLIVN